MTQPSFFESGFLVGLSAAATIFGFALLETGYKVKRDEYNPYPSAKYFYFSTGLFCFASASQILSVALPNK